MTKKIKKVKKNTIHSPSIERKEIVIDDGDARAIKKNRRGKIVSNVSADRHLKSVEQKAKQRRNDELKKIANNIVSEIPYLKNLYKGKEVGEGIHQALFAETEQERKMGFEKAKNSAAGMDPTIKTAANIYDILDTLEIALFHESEEERKKAINKMKEIIEREEQFVRITRKSIDTAKSVKKAIESERRRQKAKSMHERLKFSSHKCIKCGTILKSFRTQNRGICCYCGDGRKRSRKRSFRRRR